MSALLAPPRLQRLEAADGTPLLRGEDDLLRVADPTGTPVLVACGDGDGPLLVEAAGLPLRLAGTEAGADATADPARPVVLALHRDGADPTRFRLRSRHDGAFLDLDGGALGLAGEDAPPAWFRLVPDPAPADLRGTLHRLPAGQNLDRAGLAAMLSRPDPLLASAVLALLPHLSAGDVRGAWAASSASQARDALFGAVRAHSRAELGRFSHYTAELLREPAERFGWSIGDKTYGMPRMAEIGRGRLTIGRYCSLADPRIVLGNHQTRTGTTYPFVDLWTEWPGTLPGMSDHAAGDVVIGNDVWMGFDVVLLPGAVIGDGAVIGAGCVVRGTVPPYAICIGNPGVVVKRRFPDAVVSRLLAIRWWDWPDAMVSRYLPLLLDRDIGRFLDAAEAELGLAPAAPPALPTASPPPALPPPWLRPLLGRFRRLLRPAADAPER